MNKPMKVTLELSYTSSVRYWYKFTGEGLEVKLISKVHPGLRASFLKDATNEAYEHYNAMHQDAPIIQPEYADTKNN